ncbi:DUF2483 family protein [Mammaliicoccus sciuri]|uniref:DUF2483 family protein n=1 Tax=Mammaliicoccus sciuri TaxID=1296 RepID=UPI001FB48CAD|nr:DUF2483 family protein [Mammaliicoccus sciuri]MCJ1774654.1 DUF2483 domain-containing protein [Mammaliicoccus sciuri]
MNENRKETITYLIKDKDRNYWVMNKPTTNAPTIKYSTYKGDARAFTGLEDLSIDLTNHSVIKHTHVDIDIEEEIEIE